MQQAAQATARVELGGQRSSMEGEPGRQREAELCRASPESRAWPPAGPLVGEVAGGDSSASPTVTQTHRGGLRCSGGWISEVNFTQHSHEGLRWKHDTTFNTRTVNRERSEVHQ